MAKSVPLTCTPKVQGPSWESFAEAFVINFLTLMMSTYIKNVIFKSDSLFLQFGIYPSIQTSLTFLYRRFQSLFAYIWVSRKRETEVKDDAFI